MTFHDKYLEIATTRKAGSLKLHLIKLYRNSTKVGLKESKDVIDNFFTNHNNNVNHDGLSKLFNLLDEDFDKRHRRAVALLEDNYILLGYTNLETSVGEYYKRVQD